MNPADNGAHAAPSFETIRVSADNPAVIWKTRMHVLGADAVKGPAGYTAIDIGCDCGWTAALYQLHDSYPTVDEIPDDEWERAVEPWSTHLQVSGRLFRAHIKARRAGRHAPIGVT